MATSHLQQMTIAIMMWLLLIPPSIAQKTCARSEITSDAKFIPGQVWSYKTLPGEEYSTVTILRVEKTAKLGTIVHVRIDGIRFNCAGRQTSSVLPHAPFARAALEESVISKISTLEKLPDYSAGYQDWLSHCGGIYTINVNRVVAIDEAQFSNSQGCQGS